MKGREWERRVALVPQKELGREAILSIAPIKEEELELLVEVARENTKKVAIVETRSQGKERNEEEEKIMEEVEREKPVVKEICNLS